MPASTAALRPARALLDALAWPHGLDRYVELIAPRYSSAEVRARVTAVRRQTPDTVTLTLAPNHRWGGFEAGQHVRLSVEVDGVRRTRCYSLANSSRTAGDTIELTARVHEQGVVSTYLRHRVRPGHVVTLSPAQGSFTLPAPRPAELVLVSGGSGITPLLSMLRTLCDEGHVGPVTLLHYSLDVRHALYRAELQALAQAHPNLRVVHAFTEREAGGDLHGLFCDDHLEAAAPRWRDAEVYACGPPMLLDAVHAALEIAGRAEHLHIEAFEPPTARAPLPAGAAPRGSTVFLRSGVQARNLGATLLEQAEAAGLAPDSGCRMGICHTCTSRKVAGTTRDVRTGEVDRTPDRDIQLCINVALDDVEVST